MIVELAERLTTIHQRKIARMEDIQKINQEAVLDFVSQQMETAECLVKIEIDQLAAIKKIKTVHEAHKFIGNAIVDVGVASLEYGVNTMDIKRKTQGDILEVIGDDLTECLENNKL